jgi:hypothetical protein
MWSEWARRKRELVETALKVTRVEAVYGVNNCKDELKGCMDRGCPGDDRVYHTIHKARMVRTYSKYGYHHKKKNELVLNML